MKRDTLELVAWSMLTVGWSLVIVALVLVLTLPASAQSKPSTGDQFLVERIGNDALTIRDLLLERDGLRAKLAELEKAKPKPAEPTP